jgi:hypothetical protein
MCKWRVISHLLLPAPESQFQTLQQGPDPLHLAQQVAIRSLQTERAGTSVLCPFIARFGRKSPDICLFRQTAETRRHRSTAADLGRLSLVCLFQPGLPRSRPSVFLFVWSCSHSHSRTGDHMDEDMSPRSGCLGRMLCAPRWKVGSMVGCRW